MAGPPQLSDPQFSRFNEDPGPNTAVADAINSVTALAKAGVTAGASASLESKIKAEREKFNQLLAETGGAGNEATLSPAGEGSDLVELSIDNLIANQNTDTVTVDLREITAMEGDLAASQRAVAQGISPIRALEVNAEAITRRYIDRFPGLAAQFQKVAQTALGTTNNLMTATMRAQQELFDLQEKALLGATQAETITDRAFDAGFLLAKDGATAEIRGNAVASYLAHSQRSQAQLVSSQNEEMQIARGEVTAAQAAFNGRLRHARNNATLEVANAVSNALPQEFTGTGPEGLKSAILQVDEASRIEMQQSLEVLKAQTIFNIGDQMRNSGYISEAQRADVISLQNMVAGVYDVMIDSVSAKSISEELGYSLDALTRVHGLRFEKLFGEDALFVKNFLALVPVDSNLHNQLSRNLVQHGILERLMDYWGTGDIRSASIPGLLDNGFDPESQEGADIVTSIEQAAIGSFREFLTDPNKALAASYEPTKMLRGMDTQFKQMTPDTKRQMLDMIGMDQWDTMVQQNNTAEMQGVMDNLARQVTEWGAVKLQDATEDFVRDIADPSMANRFGIKRTPRLSTGQQLPGIAGQFSRTTPIKSGDMVNLAQGPRGIVFQPKTTKEYAALGIDTDPQNLGRIQNMISELNNIHGQGLSSYAWAMGNLGRGNSREAILGQIIAELTPDEPEAE